MYSTFYKQTQLQNKLLQINILKQILVTVPVITHLDNIVFLVVSKLGYPRVHTISRTDE